MRRIFGNYKYHGKNINNLGDHLQIIAIDYLYEQMGVRRDEIVYIDVGELSTYDGPPVYLPVSMPLINYCDRGIAGMFSPNITPVFFGLTMPKSSLLAQEVEYYKRHEPVGCRDEMAYDTMSRYGIDAYLGGCLTVALPRRESDPERQNKIFIVDPPISLREHIPKEIAENAEWGTHIILGQVDDPHRLAEEQYRRYRDEAKLMITGLLHGSVPCMAYGVPVVLARDYLSYRFAWLEALLPIYAAADYDKINWDPSAIELEEHKSVIRRLFSKRMLGDSAAEEMAYLHSFYMDRKRGDYVIDVFCQIQDFISSTWTDRDRQYLYAVWGLTQMAEMTVDYIGGRYPNARLMHVYDKRPGLSFMGLETVLPERLEDFPQETVFVTTVSAAEEAEEYFQRIGKPKSMYQITSIIR